MTTTFSNSQDIIRYYQRRQKAVRDINEIKDTPNQEVFKHDDEEAKVLEITDSNTPDHPKRWSETFVLGQPLVEWEVDSPGVYNLVLGHRTYVASIDFGRWSALEYMDSVAGAEGEEIEEVVFLSEDYGDDISIALNRIATDLLKRLYTIHSRAAEDIRLLGGQPHERR